MKLCERLVCVAMRFQNPDEITAKPAFGDRRGMSIVELSIYALVASLVLAFFIFMFWRTRRVHEQQNIEVDSQRSFAMICEQLERDLAGCTEWRFQEYATASEAAELQIGSSLFIYRIEGRIFYNICTETGDITRNMGEDVVVYPFKCDQEGAQKSLKFFLEPDTLNTLSLKIELKTVPPVKLAHKFSVRISADNNEKFFTETQLNERVPEASAGIGPGAKPKQNCRYIDPPRSSSPQRP